MGVNQIVQSNKFADASTYKFINSIKEKKHTNINKEVLFNHNSTILLLNQGFIFNVFQIKDQNIKRLFKIKHWIYFPSMICFKKSNTFMAGSLNKLINKSLIAINNQKVLFQYHVSSEATILALNSCENQIIVGGYEKILILNILNGLQIHQELYIYIGWITAISISESDIYMAISSNKNYVLIMEQCLKDTKRIWIEKQQISIQCTKSRSIFISDNILIIKLQDKDLIYIYSFNNQDQLFNYEKELELNGKSHKYAVAPLIFNQQLKILAIINRKNVNFVQILNNNQFKCQQIITNQYEMIGGIFSQDGINFALITQNKNELLLYKLMQMKEL